MTKLRTPLTFADATARVCGVITFAEAARLVGKADRTVRYWSETESTALPSIDDAVVLDRAYVAAGGEGVPFLDVYRHLLGEAIDHVDSCRRALGVDAADLARESGEAIAATFMVSQGNASPLDTHRALVEVQQVTTKLGVIARRLTSFLPIGAGPTSGKAGGTQ